MVFDLMNLDGKVALVTGSGRGLGRAMALALAEAGADIALTARTKEEIEETASLIKDLGRKAIAVSCDVTKRSPVDALVLNALSEFGRIDVLVNNAGVAIVRDFLALSEEEWRVTMDTNLTSAFLCSQAVGPVMIKQGGGKIINITSIHGQRGKAGMVAYASSKGGVIQFTRSLAVEWAQYNINVNAIGPGAFYTQPMKKVLDDPIFGEIRRKKIPLKRAGQPNELGALVVYLASKASDFMTGEVLFIDGGELAKL
jgi:NAD(P)-dependent dehydrogenase (short-subunit alcohol dehydrogenase family)